MSYKNYITEMLELKDKNVIFKEIPFEKCISEFQSYIKN